MTDIILTEFVCRLWGTNWALSLLLVIAPLAPKLDSGHQQLIYVARFGLHLCVAVYCGNEKKNPISLK
jgi:hypothetical protein